jgi:hypothetical protein
MVREVIINQPTNKQQTNMFLSLFLAIGYTFYTLDPVTAIATQKSSFQSSQDEYVGWFYTVSEDDKTVYRLGYQDVVNQENPGLGVTDISGSNAQTKWISNIPIPQGMGLYASLNIYNQGFISLCPKTPDDLRADMWVVQWELEQGIFLIFFFHFDFLYSF